MNSEMDIEATSQQTKHFTTTKTLQKHLGAHITKEDDEDINNSTAACTPQVKISSISFKGEMP